MTESVASGEGGAPLLDVIIVTYNSAGEIGECLAMLRNAVAGLDANIYVIDNGSSDETVNIVAGLGSASEVVANNRNDGFSKACNAGISRGRGRFSLLLNPDCLINADSLRNMLAFLIHHPSYVAVGPRIENANKDLSRASARRLPSLWGQCCQLFWLDRIFHRSRIFAGAYYQPWSYSDDRDVECLSGAALMCRGDVLRALDGLDESVPLYLDDIDLCARLQRFGRLRYMASATAIHHQNRSGRHHGSRVIQIVSLEAKRVYFQKHRGKTVARSFRVLVAMSGLLWVVVCPLILLAGRRERARRSFVRGLTFLEWSLARAGRDVTLPQPLSYQESLSSRREPA